MCFFPDPIVEGDHLDRADLVSVEAYGRVGRLLRPSRANKSQLFVQPQGGGESRRAEHLASRKIEHGDLRSFARPMAVCRALVITRRLYSRAGAGGVRGCAGINGTRRG